MRLNGTTKSYVANHVAESVAGVMTIRAFEKEDRFFTKNLELIDVNASPFFHNFTANEWLIQRLETVSAFVLLFATLCMVVLPPGTFSPGENSFSILASKYSEWYDSKVSKDEVNDSQVPKKFVEKLFANNNSSISFNYLTP